MATKRKWAEGLRREWHLKSGTLKVETPTYAGSGQRRVACFDWDPWSDFVEFLHFGSSAPTPRTKWKRVVFPLAYHFLSFRNQCKRPLAPLKDTLNKRAFAYKKNRTQGEPKKGPPGTQLGVPNWPPKKCPPRLPANRAQRPKSFILTEEDPKRGQFWDPKSDPPFWTKRHAKFNYLDPSKSSRRGLSTP